MTLPENDLVLLKSLCFVAKNTNIIYSSISLVSPLLISPPHRQHIAFTSMSHASTNNIFNDFHFVSEWGDICGLDTEEPLINNFDDVVNIVIEDWTSDDESVDLNNIMDVDDEFGSNFFADSIFSDERSEAQELDSVDFGLESDDYFMYSSRPVSSQSFPFADYKYRQAFKNLAQSMHRSQETRASLKLRSPVKEATKHWEERRNSISTVLSSIENSRRQIHQTYFHAVDA